MSRYFLPSFEPNGIYVPEKKSKIDFQDGGHLEFPIVTILAIFDLQVALVFPSKVRVSWPFIQENKFKIDSRWPPIRMIPIRMISAISDLQVNALILPTKFQVNWPFGSRKEVQNRFLRWRPWRPSWSLDLNDFRSFRSTVQVAPIFPSKF